MNKINVLLRKEDKNNGYPNVRGVHRMIKNPYAGMKVVPSEDLRRSVKRWMSDERMYTPKLANIITPIIDRFDEDGKPYTVINVTKDMNVQIDSSDEVRRLIFHPIYFDEYTKPISIDYKRINELI